MKSRPHAAVVEQRVALRRGAVAGDAQPLFLQVIRKLEDLALVPLDPAAIAEIGLELLVAGRALALSQLARPRRSRASPASSAWQP